MKRLLPLAVLAFLAVPADASDPRPVRIDKKPRPVRFSGNVIGLQQPGGWVVRPVEPEPEPILSDRLVEAVVCPDLALARIAADRLKPYAAQLRVRRLLNESEDLRQAREEWHLFWMNNQPSVLTFDRLNGAIGP
jgi:hypothetical protein